MKLSINLLPCILMVPLRLPLCESMGVPWCTPFSDTPGRNAWTSQVEHIASELANEIFLIAPWLRVPCHGRDGCFSQGFQLLDDFGQLPTVASCA